MKSGKVPMKRVKCDANTGASNQLVVIGNVPARMSVSPKPVNKSWSGLVVLNQSNTIFKTILDC